MDEIGGGVGAFVPVEAKPFQIPIEVVFRAGFDFGMIQVFQPQEEASPGLPCAQPRD